MGRSRKKRSPAAAASPPVSPPAQPWYRRIPAAVQWASGVVGLATAALGLVFVLLPNVKPQPDPTTASTTLTLTVEDPVSYRQYLLLEHIPPELSSPATLDRRGALVKVGAQVSGYRGRRLTLRWLLIDEADGGPAVQNDRRSFTPDRDGPFVQRIFVDVPKPGRYKIRVQVFPPEAERQVGIAPLADEDTEAFAWPPEQDG
jgi:hypothetical protein